MARIPMILYRVYVNDSQDILNTLNVLEQPSPSNYLINITDAELNPTSSQDNLLIDLTLSNFPSGYSPQEVIDKGTVTKKVQKDDQGRFYVTFQNQKYYLQSQDAIETTQNNINNSVKEIFRFYVNPIRVTPTHKKIVTQIRTRGGWEIQHWGNDLTELRVECITGGMNFRTTVKNNSDALLKSETIMNSYAWKKVTDLRTLYDQDHKERNVAIKTLLGLTYYDAFYVGYFTDFTGPVADAEKPYIMTFSFTFKVQDTIYQNSKNTLLNINSEK
jgi:hypothetical protein